MAKKKPATTQPPKQAKNAKPTGKPPVTQNQAAIEDAWANARKQAPSTGGGFDPPDIPDGLYLLQVTNARTGVYKEGTKKAGIRFFTINYFVHGLLEDDPQDDGTVLSSLVTEMDGTQIRGAKGVRSSDDLDHTREIGEGRTPMSLFSDRLKLMGIDPPDSLAKLPVLAKNLGDPKNAEVGKMFLVANIKNTYKAPDPARTYKPTETLHYQAVYVVEPWPKDQAEEFLAECGVGDTIDQTGEGEDD